MKMAERTSSPSNATLDVISLKKKKKKTTPPCNQNQTQEPALSNNDCHSINSIGQFSFSYFENLSVDSFGNLCSEKNHSLPLIEFCSSRLKAQNYSRVKNLFQMWS